MNYSTYRCSRPYKGSGLDLRWLAIDEPIAVAPRVRAIVRDIDPMKPAVTLGALARWTDSLFSITSDSHLRLGLANQQDGNRAALQIPIWFGARIDPWWDLAIHTGYDSELRVATDGYHVPITLDVRFAATEHVRIELEGGFPSVLGPQNNGGYRDLFLTVGWSS